MNDNEHGPLHFSREVPRKVKISCHQAVKVAVDDGLLLPEPCSVCGTTLHVKAHHDDYAKPLDVIWLCQSHHALRHNRLAHASSRIGGKRPNQTGRPTRAGAETTSATVRLTASERAELTAALRPGESLAGLLRDGGVRLARGRRFLCVWCGANGDAPMRDHAATCEKRPTQQPTRARLVGEEM